MWGSFKDNLQSRFSGRSSVQDPLESTTRQCATKDAMKNVVTPYSIPQFIVPPLDPDDLIKPSEGLQKSSSATAIPKEDQLNSSPQNLFPHKADSSPSNKQRRTTVKNNKAIGQQMHPGLSLQHLLSIKAGFSTLTESPNTRRKESLFLSPPLPVNDIPPSILTEYCRQENCHASDSDSEPSRNSSPLSSPFEALRNKRRLGRSNLDTDSNSSHQSTPYSSPAQQRKERKISKKKSLEIFAHCNVHDSGLSPPLSRMKLCENNNKSPTSPSLSSKTNKDDVKSKLKRSHSTSSTVEGRGNEKIDHSQMSSALVRIKLKLTYIAAQEKMNISILEAENFFVGRPVYFKVALLPRYYGYQRTDQIKVSSPNTALRERLTFELVKNDDIPYMSLEVSCKEKQGRLHKAMVIGKSIITLSDIDKQAPNELWLELKPPDLKENIHIQLSLCYDAMLGFVVADVISVRNIPKGSLGRYPDSYVVLTEEPQCDKNKKKQTEIKYRSKDPTFNQSFVFSMSNDHLVIVATLFLKDKVKGHWTAKGEVKLGQDVEHWSGQTHWAQVLAHAGKPVTFWHLLTAP